MWSCRRIVSKEIDFFASPKIISSLLRIFTVNSYLRDVIQSSFSVKIAISHTFLAQSPTFSFAIFPILFQIFTILIQLPCKKNYF